MHGIKHGALLCSIVLFDSSYKSRGGRFGMPILISRSSCTRPSCVQIVGRVVVGCFINWHLSVCMFAL